MVERTAVCDAEMEKRFLEKAPQPLRDVFLISHGAGLRLEKVMRMRWENVLWNKNLIVVPDGKTENAKQFSAVRKEAKIPKGVVLYSARHSFATDMLDRTGNIVLVSKLFGHRSVTTTQRYLHPAMKGLADLVKEPNAMRAPQENRRAMSCFPSYSGFSREAEISVSALFSIGCPPGIRTPIC